MNAALILLLIVGACILLMVGTSLLFRRWLARGLKRINVTSKRQRLDEEVDGLLEEMGNRMERAWMSQELQVVTGYREQALHALLRRGKERGLVRTEWRIHPVTHEEFEAYMLSRRGVCQFGMYAPDDQLSFTEDERTEDAPSAQPLKPVRLSDYQQAHDQQPVAAARHAKTSGTTAGGAEGARATQDAPELPGENGHDLPSAGREPVRGIRSRGR